MTLRAAYLVIALVAVLALWFLLGATGQLIRTEMDGWTPATAPGATAVPYQDEP